MFFAKVIVGVSELGNPTMRHPSRESIDTTTNRDGSIIVCYHDNQYYPEYLIFYTHLPIHLLHRIYDIF